MPSAPDKMTYWIQRADYTSADLDPVSLTEALRVLREHDWNAEFDYEKVLKASAKDNCPPGIGFVADADHCLHICPRSDGMAECYFIGPRSLSDLAGIWDRHNASRHEQDRLLELFFRADYTTLLQGFNPPPDISCRILRADSTYTSDPGPITLAKALSLLRAYDWKAELDYCSALWKAGKESCSPLIGFTSRMGSYLDILPGDGGLAQCFFWDEGKQRGWGRYGLSPEEQCRAVEFLFQGDYQSLTQRWDEFDVEASPDDDQLIWTLKVSGGASTAARRDQSLARTKELRAARRGQPAELTDAEQNLSEADAYALYRREAELENEERHRREAIKRIRASRRWLLAIAMGGTALAALLYSRMLQAWISEQLIKDLWAWSVMMMAGGFVMGCLQHLELRALLLGTKLARKQADFAKVSCGTVVFLGGAVCIALALAFVLAMLEPWLRPRLSPGLANLLPTLSDREPGRFLVASGVMLAVIGLTIGSVFAWRRAVKPTESRLASIAAVGGICLGSFTVVTVGPFFLMLPVFTASISLMALGFEGTGAWLNSNLALATALMLPVMAVFVAIAYLYGRWRAPQWEDRASTLFKAGGVGMYTYVLVSAGVLFIGLALAGLKANGILG